MYDTQMANWFAPQLPTRSRQTHAAPLPTRLTPRVHRPYTESTMATHGMRYNKWQRVKVQRDSDRVQRGSSSVRVRSEPGLVGHPIKGTPRDRGNAPLPMQLERQGPSARVHAPAAAPAPSTFRRPPLKTPRRQPQPGQPAVPSAVLPSRAASRSLARAHSRERCRRRTPLPLGPYNSTAAAPCALHASARPLRPVRDGPHSRRR